MMPLLNHKRISKSGSFKLWRLASCLVLIGVFHLHAEGVGSNAVPTNAAAIAPVEKIALTNKTVPPVNLLTGTNSHTVEPVSTPVSPISSSNIASSPTPGAGLLVVPDVAAVLPATNKVVDHLHEFQEQLDLAREQRREKSLTQATQTLTTLLQSDAPPELKRPALFEMALVAQDDAKLVKAQQVFGQYMHLYPTDPSVPEVLLRQGLIYRQMGVTTLAVSKFYAVMSSALKLKLDNIDYYKKLVLQAQVEIADTYYTEGKYQESADFFNRLLKASAMELNQPQIQFKLIRSLSFLTNTIETVAKSQIFLEQYPQSTEVPEVRFLLASALKKLGRNQESMKQVLVLLKSQEQNVHKNPEAWIYWQQRAGNEIANQLYKEGDYLNALQIYTSLAELDPSPAWQLPVWYQSALVYEQLQQWQKATDMYQHIMDRQKELTGDAATPSLVSLVEMAKWRKDYISWAQKAKTGDQAYLSKPMNSTNAVATP